MSEIILPFSVALSLVFDYSIRASEDSMGPNGINSIITGLNGMGVPIGQLDVDRPGKSGYDTAANCCNNQVVPEAVFVRELQAGVNEGLESDLVNNNHALWIASVMISKQTEGGMSPPIGVAQEADLYSSAFGLRLGILQEDAAIGAQLLAGLTWAVRPRVRKRRST
jgi:hypothetical protein